MSTKPFKQLIDCKICNKRILGTVWKIHVMGKKHMHYTPKKITVTGTFDASKINEVHDYFAGFGTIGTKKVIVHNGKVSIDYSFQDRRAHSKIIYKEHKLFNQYLKITWEEVTTPLPFPNVVNKNKRKINETTLVKPVERKKVKKDAASSKRAILDTIREPQLFIDQISILQSDLQSDKDEIQEKKKIIYDDLTAALAPMFALNRIYFFGSSVTGLEMQGSDLDVYIANVREESKPEVATLKLIRALIFKCRKFCDVLLISGAKIPIIKCIHTQTQICCDLNIKNKLSVCNSQLIRYYISLDDKLRSLIITIKYWADSYDLKKVNFFSSYAIYMMVIFYLQQIYKLPSVKDLQKNISPDLVDGWNCAFELQGFINPTLKNATLVDLVSNFFEFYSNFDYTSQIVCPYLGVSVNKTCFAKPYDLPEGFQEYLHQKSTLVVNTGICIQDPFEHCRNVAASVPLHCAAKFVMMCRNSLNIMKDSENEMLYKLLTQKPCSDYIFYVDKPDDTDADQWPETLRENVTKILSEILNMEVTKTKIHPTTYSCRGEQNIFDDRIKIYKNVATQLPPNTSEIDKEIATTKCMIKYFPQTLPINFTVDLHFKENYQVEIVMKPFSKKCKNFLHASHFFAVRLLKYLKMGIKGGENMESLEVTGFMKEDPFSGAMTHQDEKISEEKKKSSGKQCDPESETAEDGGERTADGRLTGNETSKFEENLDDEEDVPADFFDDFSNQDFMDGLDIVDAWDDEKAEGDDDEGRQRKAHSPIRFVQDRNQGRHVKKHRSKSLTRKYHKSESLTRKRSRSKSREKIKLSDRRDPEKTRRDINRDKIKVAKDREQKLVNDKLRFVETGLVPPGTEMEADIGSILREKEREKRRSTAGSSTERSKPSRERERERERERRPMMRSPSRELRKPLRFSPSPPSYRNRPREREPPYRPHKRPSSIDSNLSERELWIRSSRKRSRSRSRGSPRRSKSRKYEEAKKKKTFLEEIRDKLNETRTPIAPVAPSLGYSLSYSNAAPQPIPAPVPAPAQYFPPTPSPVLQQYDQSFFIGDSYQNVPISQSQNVIMNQPHNVSQSNMGFSIVNSGNVMMVEPLQSVQVPVNTAPVPQPKSIVSPKINILSDITLKQKEEKKVIDKETTDNIDKLFADKKISLSDFLTITAKCEVQTSSPEHLQKKIKVISRCQDAIKAMSDDRKFSGRLSVKPTSDQRNKSDGKFQSPLRRIPIVRFQFTTPAKITEEVDSFALALDKVLRKIGLVKEVVDLGPPKEVFKLTNSSFVDEDPSALTLKPSLLGIKKEMKSECEECKRRKMITFAEVGSQCVDNKNSVDMATQVTEEDLNPTKGLPKNDSIAYMTPAQLLGMDKEKEKEKAKEERLIPTPEKVESPINFNPSVKTDKPSPFKTRGGFRKGFRNRGAHHTHNNFYDYNDEFDYGTRAGFEDPAENFGGNRYGAPPRFQRPLFMEGEEQHMARVHQFREDEGNFTDFAQPYNRGGRGGRFAPRY